MTLIVDASVVAAALLQSEPHGRWALDQLNVDELAAPHLMPVEVANVLRANLIRGTISAEFASRAHAQLQQLTVAFFPYQPLAGRIWQLRETIRVYDGWYVALAEALNAPLATLDRRLIQASGPRCAFVTPLES